MTRLLLIRHGETTWNADGRWQGHADIPLSERGQEQARLLAAWMARHEVHLDIIYSSDLQRASATAEEIGKALYVPVVLEPQLREINVGTWSGKGTSEIRAADPVLFERIMAGEDLPRGGGETIGQLRARVAATVEQLVARHPDAQLAIVAHGGTIRVLLAHIEQVTTNFWTRWTIDNTSVTVVEHTDTGWKLVSINDVRHLEAAHAVIAHLPDDTRRV